MTQISSTSVSYVLRRKGVGLGLSGLEELSTTGLKLLSTENGQDNLPWDTKYVFRWGSTATIPGQGKVINSAKAIHWAFDKKNSRKEMADAGLAPKTWTYFGDFLDQNSYGDMGSTGSVIVRPASHKRSENLFYCETPRQIFENIHYRSCMNEGYYISEYIKKDRELRVWIVSGRVIAVCEKLPIMKEAISWGCVTQGTFKYIPWDEWPLFATQTALEAFSLSGLDFGAVDVMIASAGLPEPKAYVLEINTAPEVTPYYLKCLTKAFDYIVTNGPDHIPYVKNDNWRGMIHPAISNLAEIKKETA